ncbi:MAG: metal-dependent hydrolase [Terriglobia bacterium]
MDNLTHTLAGIALAQAGLKRKTRFAMLALIVASNLPDIDIVTAAGGSLTYLKFHRGITHSLIGLTVLAAALAFILYIPGLRAAPKKGAPPLSLKWLFFVCWAGTALHVLMDFTNSYGIRPFLPFSGRWYALDIMPIIGPWLLLFLLLGLCVPAVLRLASEEVGAKKGRSPAARNGAIFALCAMVALWGLRSVSHQRALGLLSARMYGEENAAGLGAFPHALNPFEWTGVAETEDAYTLLDVDALAPNLSLEDVGALHKPESSPALSVAQRTAAVKMFLNFARFPYAVVFDQEDNHRVFMRDLRFASPDSKRWNFVLEIDLNKSLRVIRQTFTFRMPEPVH